jgi:hypothetical protein
MARGMVKTMGRTSLVVVVVLLLLSSPGCGKRGGPSDYVLMKMKQQDAANALRDKGVKLAEVHRPEGDSWSVNMSGMEVTDNLLEGLKDLGYVTELDLSKTNVTDGHLARINQPEVGSLLLKLDLSKTAVTDVGLDQLTNLLILSELNLAGTKVTPAGVERFKNNRLNDKKIMVMFKSPKIKLK